MNSPQTSDEMNSPQTSDKEKRAELTIREEVNLQREAIDTLEKCIASLSEHLYEITVPSAPLEPSPDVSAVVEESQRSELALSVYNCNYRIRKACTALDVLQESIDL